MITEHDLQEAIAECEGQRNPSANTCLKLAAFYTIRDKMFPADIPNAEIIEPVRYSGSAGPASPVGYTSDTEFGRMASGMDVEKLMPVIDELLSTVQVLSPRLYAGVMRKLSDL